jgi:hypothetical protein
MYSGNRSQGDRKLFAFIGFSSLIYSSCFVNMLDQPARSIDGSERTTAGVVKSALCASHGNISPTID